MPAWQNWRSVSSLCDTMISPAWSATRLNAAAALLVNAMSPAAVTSTEIYTKKSKAIDMANCNRERMPDE
jgi:hypothetical protein